MMPIIIFEGTSEAFCKKRTWSLFCARSNLKALACRRHRKYRHFILNNKRVGGKTISR